MTSILQDLKDDSFRGPMQHLRDWTELDELHDRAAEEIEILTTELEAWRDAFTNFIYIPFENRVCKIGKIKKFDKNDDELVDESEKD